METLSYPHVEETLYREILDNGLEIIVLPKAGFQKTYATFATKYGSIDNHFAVGDQEPVKVPDGIAHFLEHKMFEEPDGMDVFAIFSKQGAAANAYTSFDRTVYLFSATENIDENLTTLIDFVQMPHFTEQNVEKEKGIIAQEINMYNDNADWRVYYGLFEALYQKHPISIDIAGTVESIYQIDKDMLYSCYNTFYHPSNMLLFVVGGVDAAHIIELVKNNQASKNFEPQGEIKRFFEEEPGQIRKARVEKKLQVSLPKCMLGFKEPAVSKTGEELLRQEVTTKLLFDIMFGSSSPFYQSLYDQQLIFDSFGHEYNCSEQYAFSILGGDTPNPDALVERIRNYISETLQSGIDAERFERVKRKKIGNYLRMLNSPESIATEFTRYRFRNCDMFNVLKYYEESTLEDVNTRLKEHFDFNQLAISIVESPST